MLVVVRVVDNPAYSPFIGASFANLNQQASELKGNEMTY